MKFLVILLTFPGFNLLCFNASGQCANIVLADSSFEEGTLAPDGSFEKGEWYPDDGCGISGAVAYEGDSSACSNGGGAYQLVSVDSNTTYYLSSYVLNGYLDPMIAFNINWVHYPITVTSNSWEFASQSFNSGSDTAIFVGFYSGGACFDQFRLTCNELVNVDNAVQIIAPYKISSTLSSNYFGLKINRPCYIEVIDLNGRIHEQINVQDGSLNFGQDLPPAIYILKTFFRREIMVKKNHEILISLIAITNIKENTKQIKILNMSIKDNHINYIEFKAKDLEEVKEFYTKAFDWSFTDYGPTYTAFSESGIAGGFEKSEDEIVNGALIVLYHKNLDLIKNKIIESGGRISKDIFSFPGGRRFHFTDPAGNELAVWSDK